MRTLDRLATEAAAAIQAGARAEAPGVKVDQYALAASLLVDAREHFLDDDGSPDWRGKTYAYRQWASDVYARSGITGDERTKAAAAIRYHVGNALRERLDDETLEALGLRTDSPRERAVEQRAEKSALLKAVTGSSTGFAGLDGLRALVAASSLLDRVNGASLADLDAEGLQVARENLAKVSRHSLELSEEIIRRTRAEASRRRRSAAKRSAR